MHRRLQLGTRENPASNGRHGSRQVVTGRSETNRIEEENITSTPLTAAHADTGGARNAALPCAATSGGKKGDATRCFSGMVGHDSSEKTTHAFEHLIDSCEAARLLGNIHVKTLQRYARRGNLPGYQIGGHWYFRASELDSWVRSKVNSERHPCCVS